ncbi:MAG: TonB-dependent receptor [Prevotella sp.]|nr:TonB-dependent receptor [Prevotella sp.]
MKKQIISLCLGFMALFSTPALAQDQTVKGTVLDESGEPIIGASVVVAGDKGKGTITDLDGNYTLSVPKNGKVVISYIGYLPQTVAPGGTITLKEDSQSLEEVVVVGYGTQKKAHLTGSVASVPVDDIQDLANGNLASSLSGLVNGLSVSGGEGRPGESASMRVRDAGSLGSLGVNSQSPLFVIDGYIYPNDVKIGNETKNLGEEAFNNLDPSEVENISVLKDASAAVYGARAANGVILVTTKKGKTGEPSISYSGQFGFTNAITRPKMLNAYDYGRLYNIIKSADPSNTSLDIKNALFQYDELQTMRGLDYDLLDKYWETGSTTRHSVNISGATDKVNYFAGISYFDQGGNLGKLEYNRWNYRAGVEVKLSKWLSAGLTVSGDYGKKETPYINNYSNRDYSFLLTHPRYIPEEVNGYAIPTYGPDGNVSGMQNYSFSVLQNNGDYSENQTNNMNINGNLSYDFGWSNLLKGLKLKFSYSKSINNDKTKQYGSAYTLYTMNQRYGSGGHLFTPTGEEDPTYNYLAASNFNARNLDNGDMLYRTMSRADNYQINFTAQYQRKFGDHDISALFSIERSEAESEWLLGRRGQPYEFTTGQWNSAEGEHHTEFTRVESGTMSYIGRINYAYSNRYLAEFLIRSDASTKFAPNNYWGTFPAISAGWIVSEEPWFSKVKWLEWVDFLKLRASWGMTGRDNLSAWQWMQVYFLDANRGVVFGEGNGNAAKSRITINPNYSAVNSDVHWDKSYKTNIGLDLQFLRKRLAINIDYYFEKNREMLLKLSQDVASTIGTTTASTNYGEMNSWGWELGITWRDQIGKDFKYHVGVNTGYSDNEVLVMDWTTKPGEMYMSIRPGGRTDTGVWGMECIGMFRNYHDIDEYFDKYLKKPDGTYGQYMGKSKDQVKPGMLIYKDVRGYDSETGQYTGPDHEVSQEFDQVLLSNRQNPYSVTTNFGCEWKGLSLSGQISANWGGYEIIPSAAISVPSVSVLESTNFASFWNPDDVYVYQDIYDAQGRLLQAMNHDAKYPVFPTGDFSINGVSSSFWRVSAARVRLTRLTIAYSIPKQWLKSVAFIKSARVNVTGQNLINFYNPYPDRFTNSWAGYYEYPNLRKWTVGVNLSF